MTSTSTSKQRYHQLERKAAFARRGQKLKALAALYKARHNDLRAYVARGPIVNAPPPQLDLFAGQ